MLMQMGVTWMPDNDAHDSLLGSTARWMANVRAMESQREDRLFNDPWAALLASEDGDGWVKDNLSDNGTSMIVRTRYFDDFLQRVAVEYKITQVVLVAAGLDTRAFRFPWPEHMDFFELDQPQVLLYKEQILSAAGAQATCNRHTIAVDLTSTWTEVLVTAGFDPGKTSIWLLEGFLPYLSNGTIAQIFDDITSLAIPGSWVGFDIINSHVLTSQWTHQWIEALAKAGVPWQGTMDDPQSFLAQRGWEASLAQPGDAEANFGRWPYPVLSNDIPNMPHNWYVTAYKK
jgi:methyltransferase (TIGR00027 family)